MRADFICLFKIWAQMFHQKGRRLHVLLNGALKRKGIIKYLNVKTRLLFSSPKLVRRPEARK